MWRIKRTDELNDDELNEFFCIIVLLLPFV